MLIQFMCKNFLSFKGETVLDMSAVNAYKEHSNNLIDVGSGEKYLKVLAIYGANASGKTNLFLAFKTFQEIIRESFDSVSGDEYKAIQRNYQPFEFTENKENTEFEIIFTMDEFEYKYGFEYNDIEVVNEWLYRKNNETKRYSEIYERSKNKTKFGPLAKKEGDRYGELVPQEALILSVFGKLKIKNMIFSEVYSEIMETFAVDTGHFDDFYISEKILPRVIESDKRSLLRFLDAIDTGITDISYKEEGDGVEIFTWHVDEKGRQYSIPLQLESHGTIKSINIYIHAKVAIKNNKSLFIDELNAKLHPLLLKFIIDLFYTETSRAQLIYTTHDTTLLRKEFFRRDQVYFVQKNTFGQSKLNALSDYKVRNDSSFEKDYLAGVYGGIPLLKDIWLKEGD